MNILFLTILNVNNIAERGLYNDLMREFYQNGHQVFIACPSERRYNIATGLSVEEGISVLRIKTLNFQKTNIFEKGLSTLLLEGQYLNAVRKYYGKIKFDLVLYSTPPITFTKIVDYFKKRDGSFSYLLLKDIFPQNAVDLGMIKEGGLLHRFFKKKERALYGISDYIGCMSPANVDYLKEHHKEIDPAKIEVNPNSIEPIVRWLDHGEKILIRKKYSIPIDSTVFVYGGNLGKPQGIDFLIQALQAIADLKNVFFLIIGSGTEFIKLKSWFDIHQPSNALLHSSLTKKDYDDVIQSSDVGLIFLDKRFTIPNFPSRILTYMECKLPVIAATDIHTDLGAILEEHKFGFWCENGEIVAFINHVIYLAEHRKCRLEMGNNGYNFLLNNYLVRHSIEKVLDHF